MRDLIIRRDNFRSGGVRSPLGRGNIWVDIVKKKKIQIFKDLVEEHFVQMEHQELDTNWHFAGTD